MVGLKSKPLPKSDQLVVKVWILALPYKSTPSFVVILSSLKGRPLHYNLQ